MHLVLVTHARIWMGGVEPKIAPPPPGKQNYFSDIPLSGKNKVCIRACHFICLDKYIYWVKKIDDVHVHYIFFIFKSILMKLKIFKSNWFFQKTTQLKNMLNSKELEFIMEAHNGLSARIVEEAGNIFYLPLSIWTLFSLENRQACL